MGSLLARVPARGPSAPPVSPLPFKSTVRAQRCTAGRSQGSDTAQLLWDGRRKEWGEVRKNSPLETSQLSRVFAFRPKFG